MQFRRCNSDLAVGQNYRGDGVRVSIKCDNDLSYPIGIGVITSKHLWDEIVEEFEDIDLRGRHTGV